MRKAHQMTTPFDPFDLIELDAAVSDDGLLRRQSPNTRLAKDFMSAQLWKHLHALSKGSPYSADRYIL